MTSYEEQLEARIEELEAELRSSHYRDDLCSGSFKKLELANNNLECVMKLSDFMLRSIDGTKKLLDNQKIEKYKTQLSLSNKSIRLHHQATLAYVKELKHNIESSQSQLRMLMLGCDDEL